MIRFRLFMALFAVLSVITFSLPQLSYGVNAYSPIPTDACTVAPENPACVDNNKDPITGSGGIITRVSNVIAFAAAVIAVIMIIFSGFRLVKSGGDPGKVTQARETIIYSLVGLVVIAVSRALVGLVISNV